MLLKGGPDKTGSPFLQDILEKNIEKQLEQPGGNYYFC